MYFHAMADIKILDCLNKLKSKAFIKRKLFYMLFKTVIKVFI